MEKLTPVASEPVNRGRLSLEVTSLTEGGVPAMGCCWLGYCFSDEE